jgi:hypothetical protein
MVNGSASGVTPENAEQAKEMSFAGILVSMMNKT